MGEDAGKSTDLFDIRDPRDLATVQSNFDAVVVDTRAMEQRFKTQVAMLDDTRGVLDDIVVRRRADPRSKQPPHRSSCHSTA